MAVLDSLCYEIEDFLGGGIYSDVYRARGPRGPVVVKVARVEPRDADEATNGMYFVRGKEFHTGQAASWDPDPNKILYAEAEVLARSNHPAMVRLVDSGTVDDLSYIVTEYIEGVTWRESLYGDNPPSVRNVYQLVKALQAMRKIGDVACHGDIKPDNLLLDRDGQVRIIDPSAGLTELDELTSQPKRMLVTPLYNPLYLNSDIPALGLLIIEVGTGEQPLFMATQERHRWSVGPGLEMSLKAAAATGLDAIWGRVPFMPLPTELREDFSDGLEAIALRCLGLLRHGDQLDCCDSYRHLEDLLEALSGYV